MTGTFQARFNLRENELNETKLSTHCASILQFKYLVKGREKTKTKLGIKNWISLNDGKSGGDEK